MESLGLKAVTAMAKADDWAQFAALARTKGLTVSSLLRLVVAQELRRAKLDAAKDAAIAPVKIAR